MRDKAMQAKGRIAAFIDGFNVYHSLNARPALRHLKWVNYRKLCHVALGPDGQKDGAEDPAQEVDLRDVLYFTTYHPTNQQKRARHERFIRALATVGVEMIPGSFKVHTHVCYECGSYYDDLDEKKTDVNIATKCVEYAARDRLDTALLVTGDTDQVPLVHLMRKLFPGKVIGVLFPMDRINRELRNACDFSKRLNRWHFEVSQLPERIHLPGGSELVRPIEWGKTRPTRLTWSELASKVCIRSRGVCEACGEPAPFLRPDGTPYLELHPVDPDVGPGHNTPATVAALCPNCHREAHHGAEGTDLLQKLRAYLAECGDDSASS